MRVLRYEFRLLLQHRRAIKKARSYAGQTGLRLNLGSGDKRREGWIHIDRHPSADLQLDLREELPFAPGSASQIYSEHFFEHLEYPKQVGVFLKEARRILEVGGIFSVGVPDTEWPVLAYSQDPAGYFELAQKKFHPKWCDTKMHQLNYHFRQGDEHKYAYDFETLSKVLRRAGFKNINRRHFDSNRDTESRRIGTLYVDAHN